MAESTEKALLRTIEYARQYGGMTKDQLFFRVMGDKKRQTKELEVAYKKLGKNESGGGILRIESDKKLGMAAGLANFLWSYSGVLMVGVTGSVAAETADKEDDIDVMVITKTDQLWLTRILIWWWLVSHNIPIRRRGKAEQSNQICLNLWLDEGSLAISKSRQNIRSGMDLIMMKPLVNKENSYERFILANNWANKWVATGYQQIVEKMKDEGPTSESGMIIKMANFIAFWLQRLWMQKIDHEEVGIHKAYFYP